MGTNLTYHLAGGDMGMRHMLAQFGPALKLPWTKLEAPEFTEELIDRMVEGTREQAKGTSIKDLERLRDDCLIAIMRALKQFDYAAGKVLNELENKRYSSKQHLVETGKALELYQDVVRSEWIDYNGHLNDGY